MEKTEMLHELCKELMKELETVNEKISRAGGMSAGDLETVDKLTHAIKSLKTTIAMMEADDDGGYSGRYMMPRYYGGMSYADGRSDGRGGSRSYNDGRSYARGRMNAQRDSMGRYSRGDGYSYADGMEEMLGELEDMLPELSGDKRSKAQRLIDELRR